MAHLCVLFAYYTGGVQGKVNALAAAARLRAGAPSPAFGGAEAGLAVDKASLESVFNVLSQYSEALGKLQVGSSSGVGGTFLVCFLLLLQGRACMRARTVLGCYLGVCFSSYPCPLCQALG